MKSALKLVASAALALGVATSAQAIQVGDVWIPDGPLPNITLGSTKGIAFLYNGPVDYNNIQSSLAIQPNLNGATYVPTPGPLYVGGFGLITSINGATPTVQLTYEFKNWQINAATQNLDLCPNLACSIGPSLGLNYNNGVNPYNPMTQAVLFAQYNTLLAIPNPTFNTYKAAILDGASIDFYVKSAGGTFDALYTANNYIAAGAAADEGVLWASLTLQTGGSGQSTQEVSYNGAVQNPGGTFTFSKGLYNVDPGNLGQAGSFLNTNTFSLGSDVTGDGAAPASPSIFQLGMTFHGFAETPEPGSIALLGLGLVAAGLARRRKQQA